jgi:hypothetical protein
MLEKGILVFVPGAVKIENIANTIADNSRIYACSRIAVSKIWIFESHLLIICGKTTNVNASVTASELLCQC